MAQLWFDTREKGAGHENPNSQQNSRNRRSRDDWNSRDWWRRLCARRWRVLAAVISAVSEVLTWASLVALMSAAPASVTSAALVFTRWACPASRWIAASMTTDSAALMSTHELGHHHFRGLYGVSPLYDNNDCPWPADLTIESCPVGSVTE